MLLERAGKLLEDPAQGLLDLGIEPKPQVKGLVSLAAGPDLFYAAEPPVPAGRDDSGRVVGTDSRVRFTALPGVFTSLGFDGLGD